MPDGVIKRNAARHIENHPQRIDNPACGKQPDAARRQDHRQLINHNQRQPPHTEIGHQRQRFKAMRNRELEQNTGQRQPPDHRHQSIRQRRPERDQQKRRIGASNQQIDGAVIKLFQPGSGRASRNSVIERRGQK